MSSDIPYAVQPAVAPAVMRAFGNGGFLTTPFSPQQMAGYSFYTSGSRADQTSGPFNSLTVLGNRPAMVASNGPTVASGVMTFDGTNDFAGFPAIVTQTATLPLQSATDLPVASGSGANGGFTCTGLDRLPNGNWIVGNDGRGTDTDGSTSINSSVVILSPDFTTKVAEFITQSVGIAATNKSLQGVAYLSASNEIAFAMIQGTVGTVYLLDATTFAYKGEWSPGGTPFGTINNLNGLGYDPDLDALIIFPINTAAITWRSRSTGLLIKNVMVTADINSDQVFYSRSRKGIFYTQGASGTDGQIIERVASRYVQNVVTNFTLTGADAIEGCYIDGNTLYIMNDAGFHASTATIKKNRVLTYDISSLQARTAWPIGQSAQLFGIIRIPTAQASTDRTILGLGNGFSDNYGGVALSAIFGVTNRLRVTTNSTTSSWTTTDLSVGSHMIYMNCDLVSDTAQLWVDGVSIGTVTLSASSTTNFIDPAPVFIASDQGTGRYFAGEITCAGASVDGLSSRQQIEGFMAWDTGNVALLPANHPYKNVAP